MSIDTTTADTAANTLQVSDERLQKEYRTCTKRLPMRAFFGMKMPAGLFVGLRVDKVTTEETVVSVPGGWRTQNPFGTMYWAVQGMAAELATAVYVNCLSRCTPIKLRMFVVGTEARFGKKAYGRCNFTCSDAFRVDEALQESLKTGKSINCDLTAIGTDAEGETVSEWVFKWNFLATEQEH